ncbi:MAG: arginase family protein, partial [Candidatus Nanopelagicales bacterium]
MTRYGAMFGPDITFLGVEPIDINDAAALNSADVVIVGAPFDGGTSYRAGARFGPSAIRGTDYLPHDGSRPSLALGVDALKDIRVVDMGDVEMFSGDIEKSCQALESTVERIAAHDAIPLILGGDHTITWPNVTGIAKAKGFGKVGV